MNKNNILQFCWRHKLFGTHLYTEGWKPIEVVDPGLYDKTHGSLFFNAKVKMDGVLLIGNVLVLDFSHEFFESIKDYKMASSNIILVVCNVEDQQCINLNAETVPTVVVEAPDYIKRNYDLLMSDHGMTYCHHHIKKLTSSLCFHVWLSSMQMEHLEKESENVRNLVHEHCSDWYLAFMGQLFRAFGLGINCDTMSIVYSTIPSFFFTSRHIDDLFQVEAVVFGQAGLLELDTIPEKYQEKALKEGYFSKLRNEWLYLANKFDMPKPVRHEWKLIGRGQHATPHVLLSMLANLIYMRKLVNINMLGEVKILKDVFAFVTTNATPYWKMHSHFGVMTQRSNKSLSRDRQSRIIMDCHIPLMFAYGRYKGSEKMCDLAFDLMEQMKPYRTHEVAYFERFGVKPETAGDVVALCHMKANFCDKLNCIDCRFGYEFMKKYKDEQV